MARLPYRCEDLPDPNSPCYDFTPSMYLTKEARKTPTDELDRQYVKLQRQCRSAAEQGNQERYDELGCKRQGHLIIPGGRAEGVRGLVQGRRLALTQANVPEEQRSTFAQRLTSWDRPPGPQTPINARTQATPLRARMKESGKDREQKKIEFQRRTALTRVIAPMLDEVGNLTLDANVLAQHPKFLELLEPTMKSRIKAFFQTRQRTFPSKFVALPESTYAIILKTQLARELIKQGYPALTASSNERALVLSLGTGEDWPVAFSLPSGVRALRLLGASRGTTSAMPEPVLLAPTIDQVFLQAGQMIRDEKQAFTAADVTSFRLLLNTLRRQRGNVIRLTLGRVGGNTTDTSMTIDVPVTATLQHSISSQEGGKQIKPNYPSLTNLDVNSFVEYLLAEPRVRHRGRYLRPMD